MNICPGYNLCAQVKNILPSLHFNAYKINDPLSFSGCDTQLKEWRVAESSEVVYVIAITIKPVGLILRPTLVFHWYNSIDFIISDSLQCNWEKNLACCFRDNQSVHPQGTVFTWTNPSTEAKLQYLSHVSWTKSTSLTDLNKDGLKNIGRAYLCFRAASSIVPRFKYPQRAKVKINSPCHGYTESALWSQLWNSL